MSTFLLNLICSEISLFIVQYVPHLVSAYVKQMLKKYMIPLDVWPLEWFYEEYVLHLQKYLERGPEVLCT